MTLQAPLPVVVEFDHRHSVALEKTEHGTRVVTTVAASKYPIRKMQDLPFVGQPGNWEHLCWWYFPTAANWKEAQVRGKYFWEEFVRFTRGTQKKRPEAARDLLGYILRDMPLFTNGRQEADVFKQCLAEATVAHFRVGLDAEREVAA